MAGSGSRQIEPDQFRTEISPCEARFRGLARQLVTPHGCVGPSRSSQTNSPAQQATGLFAFAKPGGRAIRGLEC